MIDLEKLETLARAATQGDWTHEVYPKDQRGTGVIWSRPLQEFGGKIIAQVAYCEDKSKEFRGSHGEEFESNAFFYRCLFA